MNALLATLAAWYRPRRKAIAALAVPLLVALAARYGLELDPGAVTALTAILTGAAVHQISNAPSAPVDESTRKG